MTYPKEFLQKLDKLKHKTIYARIIALDLNELPLEQIEGKITGGSISVDGASAIRRTCSLQIVAQRQEPITDVYWSLKNKFKLEIGVQNTIDTKYPDIIWFKQGIYLISSFSTSETLNSLSVSISGKDKMANLNGEFAGHFGGNITLDTIEEVAKDGSVDYVKYPIYDIIRNMIHQYGQEPFQNILINDLAAYGYELWDFMGVDSQNNKDFSLYFFRDPKTGQVKNMTLDKDKYVYKVVLDDATAVIYFDVVEDEATGEIHFVALPTTEISQNYMFQLKEIIASDFYSKTTIGDRLGGQFVLDEEQLEKKEPRSYYIEKIRYGDTAGYHRTALIYPGDLVMNAGETVCAALDKIVAILGEFEYFYDLDGRFVFQKKKTYVQNLFTPLNGDAVDSFVEVSPYSYEFEDDEMLVSISNSPNINEVRNDFTIWGNRRNENGGDKLPIMARYAIDKKPTQYHTFDWYKKDYSYTYLKEGGDVYSEEEKKNAIPAGALDDYYIFEDAFGYRLATEEDDNMDKIYLIPSAAFVEGDKNLYKLDENGNYVQQNKVQFYHKENNYFEPYSEEELPPSLDEAYVLGEASKLYTVEKVDWRELIWLMQRDFYQHNLEPDYNLHLAKLNPEYADKGGRTGYEQYYTDIQGFWRQIYDPTNTSADFVQPGDPEGERFVHWARKILYYPESVNFWFDFLDTGGPIDDYSVKAIGIRSKIDTANQNGVTAIFYRPTPDVEFVVMPIEDASYTLEEGELDFQPIYIQENMRQMFNISSQGKSASQRIDELIWKHACGAESVTISCIPIYYLEPNTIIKVRGEEYVLSKISVPLNYNGTMSLTATKIIKPI